MSSFILDLIPVLIIGNRLAIVAVEGVVMDTGVITGPGHRSRTQAMDMGPGH